MERLTFKVHDGGVFVKESDVKTFDVEDEVMHTGNSIRKLGEYEDLEEQGLLLKLPCKRGDTVYFIKSAFSIAAFPIDSKVVSVNGIDCDNDVMYSAITNYNKIERRFKSSDIGKTVFLTKTEAEEALKIMNSNG